MAVSWNAPQNDQASQDSTRLAIPFRAVRRSPSVIIFWLADQPVADDGPHLGEQQARERSIERLVIDQPHRHDAAGVKRHLP